MTQLNDILWRNQGQVLTPELIAGILQGAAYVPPRYIDFAPFEPAEYNGFTFQPERFEEVVAELAPLHQLQWKEVDERLNVFDFRPNYDGYAKRDRDGGLIQFTVRKDGVLVGYCLMLLTTSMHTQTLSAVEDSFYLHPDHRGGFTMIRFTRYMIECLKALGVQEVRVTSKLSNKSYVLMQRAGFKPCAMQLVLMMKEAPCA